MNWKSLIDFKKIKPEYREIHIEIVEKGLQADMAAVAKFLEDEGRTDDLEKHLQECKKWGIDLAPGFEFLERHGA